MNKDDTILKADQDDILMEFLIRKLASKSRDNIKSLLKNKQVWTGGKAVSQYNHPLHINDEVVIRWARSTDLPSEKHMKIVFEDEHLIVIDKKAGLLSVSDGQEHQTAYGILTEWVKKQSPLNRIYIVHRLDQYTSGLLMFVKSEKIQNIFRENWRAYITERAYSAVVEGEVKKQKGRISSYLSENQALLMVSSQDPSKGKLAITNYQVIQAGRQYSLLKVNLETGKKNQIRVHMKDIGHSIAGDRKYGARSNPVGRLCLHATILAFRHPVTGKDLKFESPTPQEFLRVI
jgi:23S rRNA pseudouridine1911/1915/1917 synthase